MARRRDLSPDETKLWRRVATTTKAYKPLPLVHTDTAPSAPSQLLTDVKGQAAHPELPHMALKRRKAATILSRPPEAAPVTKKPVGVLVSDASGHKKVRRGKLQIDGRIDLHGMRQIEARTALAGMIARTRANNGRCILVVTGKGVPIDPGEDFITPQPGVIRRRLPEWLNGAGIREHVSGFASANAKDGGAGAFYVLLKSAIMT
jgi:DNA-nicking Smr family endonuclease